MACRKNDPDFAAQRFCSQRNHGSRNKMLIEVNFDALRAEDIDGSLRKERSAEAGIKTNDDGGSSVLFLHPVGSGFGHAFDVIYGKIFGDDPTPAVRSEF